MAPHSERIRSYVAGLDFRLDNGIARLRINRPKSRNALTFAMYEQIAEIVGAMADDRDVKALVVAGAGSDAFAAGTDIGELASIDTAEAALAYEALVERAVSALEHCRFPTIAAIAGACAGGGAAIAAVCDIRIAASNLRFGHPMARTTGNCLSMANYARLVALVGEARVKELVILGRFLDAVEARAIGLVAEVVEDTAALWPRALEVAAQAAGQAPLTIWATKEALRRLRPRIEPKAGEDLLLSCYLSDDFREGTDAFLAKRAPSWRGR